MNVEMEWSNDTSALNGLWKTVALCIIQLSLPLLLTPLTPLLSVSHTPAASLNS